MARAVSCRSLHRVDANRVVAEQRALLVRREVAHDLAEAAEDRRRSVAHRLSTGKLLANMQRSTPKRSITVRTMSRLAAAVHGCPRWPRPEIFTADVRARRERRHRALPPGDAFGAAIGRQPGVIEDDLRVGKVGRRAARPPRDATTASAGRSAGRCARAARSPRATSRSVMPPGARVARRRVGARLVAHAAHERERRLLLRARCGASSRVEPRLRHRDASAGRARGAARRCSASRRPGRADSIRPRRRPSSSTTKRRGIRAVVGRQVAAADRAVVAVAKRDAAARRSATGSSCVAGSQKCWCASTTANAGVVPADGCVTSLTDRSAHALPRSLASQRAPIVVLARSGQYAPNSCDEYAYKIAGAYTVCSMQLDTLRVPRCRPATARRPRSRSRAAACTTRWSRACAT